MIANRLRALKIKPQQLSRFMGGGHDHGPLMPPFARLRPPTKSLSEETELVWDDSVAPETAIDFDAPHVSTGEVAWTFFLGASFFFFLYAFIGLNDPAKRSPLASKQAIISVEDFRADVGLAVRGAAAEDEEHDEE